MNDCHQVHFSSRLDIVIFIIPNITVSDVFFKVKRPQQEITIRYSATVSFWDLVSVILNSASFLLNFLSRDTSSQQTALVIF